MVIHSVLTAKLSPEPDKLAKGDSSSKSATFCKSTPEVELLFDKDGRQLAVRLSLKCWKTPAKEPMK